MAAAAAAITSSPAAVLPVAAAAPLADAAPVPFAQCLLATVAPAAVATPTQVAAATPPPAVLSTEAGTAAPPELVSPATTKPAGKSADAVSKDAPAAEPLPVVNTLLAPPPLQPPQPPQRSTARMAADGEAMAKPQRVEQGAVLTPLARPALTAVAPVQMPATATAAAVTSETVAASQPVAWVAAATAGVDEAPRAAPAPSPGGSVPTLAATPVAATTTVMATAAPQAAPPVALDQPDWPQQLGEQIHWRLGEGLREARIEVSPRELGPVDVQLSMDERGLRVQLSASHAQTRELLLSELPRLRECLQQHGVQLADAQVSRDHRGRDAPQQPQHAAHTPMPEDAVDAAATAPSRWLRGTGLLDHYA